MFVCSSILIVIILHMMCIVYNDAVEPDEMVESVELFKSTKSPNKKKLIFKRSVSNDYEPLTNIYNLNKCNGIRRTGKPCKQDGTKSGGEIINGYCMYHKKIRK